MSNIQLTEGILVKIMTGAQVSNPVLQVLGCKKIAADAGVKDRHRLLLSDGKYTISFAMLATQLNEKVTNGQLSNNSVIMVRRYIRSPIPPGNESDSRRILVLLELDVMVSGQEIEKIGHPEALTFAQLAALMSANTESVTPVPSVTSAPVVPKPQPSMSTQNEFWTPIETLNPYNTKWRLKVRVTYKTPIRTWSNSKGEGKLFSMNLCDETGEIQATAFNSEVDKFYDFIEIDKAYFISRGQIKLANKQYNNLKNDYEITLSRNTAIEECMDCEVALPKMSYEFVPIDKLSSLDPTAQIDVIGVCKKTGDCVQITTKAGKPLKKRELTLIDQSNTSIVLAFWGKEAEDFDGSLQPVIAVKSAWIRDFMGGKSVATGLSSTIRINPDIPEAHKLREWFDNQGVHLDSTVNLSARSAGMGSSNLPMLTIEEAKQQAETCDGKLEFQTFATILLTKTDKCVYKACPSEGCNRKVEIVGDNLYQCRKCDKITGNFSFRLILNLIIFDSTGELGVTCFADEAEKVIGHTSQEIGEMKDDEEKLDDVVAEKNFEEFIFKCRSTMESYQDERLLKTVVLAVEPINTDLVCNALLKRLSRATGVIFKE